MASRIEGKVAQILTERELVINVGEASGVRVGMRFAVLNRKGANIVDPDTGKNLGSVDLPKTFVKVISVEEKMAVARTFREFTRTTISTIFGGPAKPEFETLKLNSQTAKAELDEADSYVKIGDPVVQMVRDEFAGAPDS